MYFASMNSVMERHFLSIKIGRDEGELVEEKR